MLMDGMRFTYSVHLHGTLAANASGEFSLPCGATLVHISASNSAATDGILDVGTSGDPDGILTDGTLGDSNTPAVFEPDDFDGALVDGVSGYHFAKGDILDWDLDFDGAGGTAAANVSLVFTFVEG
jgi:hypothetical protein